MSTDMTITVNIVPGTDGTPDRAASQAAVNTAFTQAFDKLLADQTLQFDTIASAVSEYFEENSGKAIAMPTVASQVATLKLNSQPETHGKLSGLVLEYLRANSKKGDTNSLFQKRGGPQGGISVRTAAQPAEGHTEE